MFKRLKGWWETPILTATCRTCGSYREGKGAMDWLENHQCDPGYKPKLTPYDIGYRHGILTPERITTFHTLEEQQEYELGRADGLGDRAALYA